MTCRILIPADAETFQAIRRQPNGGSGKFVARDHDEDISQSVRLGHVCCAKGEASGSRPRSLLKEAFGNSSYTKWSRPDYSRDLI